MPDWFMHTLAAIQGGIVRDLAAAMRAGGLAAASLAFTLGALHALTPGHGKAALTAYFLGQEARIGRGVRVALSAAALHVVSGFLMFLALRYVLGQALSVTGRASPNFTAIGYAFIIAAGLLMLIQSFGRPHAHSHETKALIAGVGLLPCPLTISVLGFAWAQGAPGMIGLVLVSLALGVAATIGLVAVLAIIGRHLLGAALAGRLPQMERASRLLQRIAGAAIIAIGVYAIAGLGR